eukprot:gene4692-9300_t
MISILWGTLSVFIFAIAFLCLISIFWRREVIKAKVSDNKILTLDTRELEKVLQDYDFNIVQTGLIIGILSKALESLEFQKDNFKQSNYSISNESYVNNILSYGHQLLKDQIISRDRQIVRKPTTPNATCTPPPLEKKSDQKDSTKFKKNHSPGHYGLIDSDTDDEYEKHGSNIEDVDSFWQDTLNSSEILNQRFYIETTPDKKPTSYTHETYITDNSFDSNKRKTSISSSRKNLSSHISSSEKSQLQHVSEKSHFIIPPSPLSPSSLPPELCVSQYTSSHTKRLQQASSHRDKERKLISSLNQSEYIQLETGSGGEASYRSPTTTTTTTPLIHPHAHRTPPPQPSSSSFSWPELEATRIAQENIRDKEKAYETAIRIEMETLSDKVQHEEMKLREQFRQLREVEKLKNESLSSPPAVTVTTMKPTDSASDSISDSGYRNRKTKNNENNDIDNGNGNGNDNDEENNDRGRKERSHQIETSPLTSSTSSSLVIGKVEVQKKDTKKDINMSDTFLSSTNSNDVKITNSTPSNFITDTKITTTASSTYATTTTTTPGISSSQSVVQQKLQLQSKPSRLAEQPQFVQIALKKQKAIETIENTTKSAQNTNYWREFISEDINYILRDINNLNNEDMKEYIDIERLALSIAANAPELIRNDIALVIQREDVLILLAHIIQSICNLTPIFWSIIPILLQKHSSYCMPDLFEVKNTTGNNNSTSNSNSNCNIKNSESSQMRILFLYGILLSNYTARKDANKAIGLDMGDIWQWLVRCGKQLSFLSESLSLSLSLQSNPQSQSQSNIKGDSLSLILTAFSQGCKATRVMLRCTGRTLASTYGDELKILIQAYINTIDPILNTNFKVQNPSLSNIMSSSGSSILTPIKELRQLLDGFTSSKLSIPLMLNNSQEPHVLNAKTSLIFLAHFRQIASNIDNDHSVEMSHKKQDIRIQVENSEVSKLKMTFNIIGDKLESQEKALKRLSATIQQTHSSGHKDLLEHSLYKISDEAIKAMTSSHFDPIKHGTALARVLSQLCASSHVISDLIRAQIFFHCPLTIPLFQPDATEDYRTAMGYRSIRLDNEEIEWESADKWISRMSKVLGMFATMAVQSSQNPFGVGDVWEWIARTVNFAYT